VRSVRSECLSHFILFGEGSLRRAMKTASIKGKTTFCSSPPQFGLSPVGDVASAVENAWAAYSGTIARRTNILTKREQL
jgi:hypothetical protein